MQSVTLPSGSNNRRYELHSIIIDDVEAAVEKERELQADMSQW
jgi:hypothetical protein